MDKLKKLNVIDLLEAQAKQLRKLGWTSEADQAQKIANRNKRRLERADAKAAKESK
jgi:hypothetical protein